MMMFKIGSKRENLSCNCCYTCQECMIGKMVVGDVK